MKLCVPVEKNEGLKSKIYDHFGSAPFFAIYDDDSGKLEFVDNSNKDHVHGMCNPIQSISGKNVDCVFVRGIGGGAIRKLKAAKIKIYKCDVNTIEELINYLKSGKLSEIAVEDSCKDHGCH